MNSIFKPSAFGSSTIFSTPCDVSNEGSLSITGNELDTLSFKKTKSIPYQLQGNIEIKLDLPEKRLNKNKNERATNQETKQNQIFETYSKIWKEMTPQCQGFNDRSSIDYAFRDCTQAAINVKRGFNQNSFN